MRRSLTKKQREAIFEEYKKTKRSPDGYIVMYNDEYNTGSIKRQPVKPQPCAAPTQELTYKVMQSTAKPKNPYKDMIP